MLFVGQCKPDLSGLPSDSTGGRELSFNGYFFWSPKVVPKENNGLLIRIGDASGTLFDDTFMHYEVSEQTRLRQITSELFIHQGLDAALNIDRESFNFSHPHYQFITKWTHRALRQFATRHKALGSSVTEESRRKEAAGAQRKLRKVISDALKQAPDANYEPSDVELVEDSMTTEARELRKRGFLVLSNRVLDAYPKPERSSPRNIQRREHFIAQMIGLAQILDSYGLLKRLDYDQQEILIRSIAHVFLTGPSK